MWAKFETAFLAILVFGVAFLAVNLLRLDIEADYEVSESFVEADQEIFARNFSNGNRFCKVGLSDEGICFGRSPFEDMVQIGKPLPEAVPRMPAPLPVVLRTQPKATGLETWRYGRVLVLVQTDNRLVQDVLDLREPDWLGVPTYQMASGGEDGILTLN